MVMADAVTPGRQAKARHALREARGEPAEATIPKRGIGLDRAHPVVIDAEIAKGAPHDFVQPEIADDIVDQSTDQKLQREIVDPLAALGETCAVSGEPAVNDAVA